jgi:hypothetical protein
MEKRNELAVSLQIEHGDYIVDDDQKLNGAIINFVYI